MEKRLRSRKKVYRSGTRQETHDESPITDSFSTLSPPIQYTDTTLNPYNNQRVGVVVGEDPILKDIDYLSQMQSTSKSKNKTVRVRKNPQKKKK